MKDADMKHIELDMQPDGSWIGKSTKYGKEITVREAKPEDALTKLLTHPGE